MPTETAVKWTLEWMCLVEAFGLCAIRSDVQLVNPHLTVGGIPGTVFLCVGALTWSLSSDAVHTLIWNIKKVYDNVHFWYFILGLPGYAF